MVTFAVQFHRWRGFGFGKDVLFRWLVLGFLSAGLAVGVISDRLHDLHEALKKLRGDGK
jgi:hypothetical protein